MSEINENENEVENETETETGYVRVKRVYATTEDEVTLIVEPIDGAVPENGVKMQDGTYRVVWSMKHVKDLIRKYVVYSMNTVIKNGHDVWDVSFVELINMMNYDSYLRGISELIVDVQTNHVPIGN